MITNNDLLTEAVNRVKAFHSSDTTGHDWWHIYRVWNMAKHIAQCEGANMLVVELAALLHDMDDHKIEGADAENLPNATQILNNLGVDNDLINNVLNIIKQVSFKGANVKNIAKTLEASVVQDADRLDAIGAIGIARAFAYGGSKHRELYNPDSKPVLHTSFDEYKNSKGSTLNHFYEKLLLLKDMLNTNTAKKIAEKRHEYMKGFVEQFLDEWEVRDVE
jgi:uncharacterized protein